MTRIRPHLNTTLDPTIHAELKRKAEAQKVPVATLIEDAWLFFKGEPTPLTIARQQMLFGTPAKVKRVA